jgi:peptidoglycan/xylan/chitin deacetylase (PgdA/CDA1 family)
MSVLRQTGEELRRFKMPSLILLYHRVSGPAFDPLCLSVTPEHFEQHMRVLSRNYLPTPLEEMRHPHSAEESRLAAVAVTFDDGYADNLLNALPVLEQERIPATVFCVGWQGAEQPGAFWWDRVLELIFGTQQWLFEPLGVTLAGITKRWSMMGQAAGVLEPVDETWSVLRRDDPDERYSAYRWLSSALRECGRAQRDDAMRGLEEWAGDYRGPSTVGEAPRRLGATELAELAKSPMVAIGSHTMTHPVLAHLVEEEQFDEILSAKLALESLAGRKVPTFSFPFGTRADFNAATLRALTRAGVTLACGNYPGHVSGSTRPYDLPRYLVRDCGGEAFEAFLREVSAPIKAERLFQRRLRQGARRVVREFRFRRR